MSVEITIVLMGLMMLVLFATGLSVVFCLGTVAFTFSFITLGEKALIMLPSVILKVSSIYILMAVPLFIFMAAILQYSGIAEELFKTIRFWMGSIKGGLGMGVVVICTVMAAMTGTSGAGTLTMGTIALPIMKKLNYDRYLSIGCVAAGGVLGILIPPSIIMIIYASVTGESVGRLFAGGMFPGLLLATLYIIYVGVRCYFNPRMGPPIPVEERGTFKDKFVSLKGVILPVLVALSVLGVIYTGVATPTEAASFGAAGAIISAAIYRRLNWKIVKTSAMQSFGLLVMALWLYAAAVTFNQTFQLMGGSKLVQDIAVALPVGRWGILIMMMLTLFVLGCFMDDYAVVLLAAPIFVPVVQSLGFNTFWFAILFMVNMQMAYLTPPYGFNLFYMRALLPSKEVSMVDIYKSVVPFIGLQAIGLAFCMIFPPICTWLPGVLFH